MGPFISLGLAAGSAVARTVAVPVIKAGISAGASFLMGIGGGIAATLGVGGIVRKVRGNKPNKPNKPNKEEKAENK